MCKGKRRQQSVTKASLKEVAYRGAGGHGGRGRRCGRLGDRQGGKKTREKEAEEHAGDDEALPDGAGGFL